MTVTLTERPEGAVEFWVHVQPRAGRASVSGVRDGALVVRVTAPPVEGAANEAVRRLLAELLAVPISRIAIAQGERSRRKLIRITGIASSQLLSRLVTLAEER